MGADGKMAGLDKSMFLSMGKPAAPTGGRPGWVSSPFRPTAPSAPPSHGHPHAAPAEMSSDMMASGMMSSSMMSSTMMSAEVPHGHGHGGYGAPRPGGFYNPSPYNPEPWSVHHGYHSHEEHAAMMSSPVMSSEMMSSGMASTDMMSSMIMPIPDTHHSHGDHYFTPPFSPYGHKDDHLHLDGPYGQEPEEPAPATEMMSSVDTTGWWSKYEQYSPPHIEYKAAYSKKPVFALCELKGEISGKVSLMQAPGSAVMAKVALSGAEADSDYRISIKMQGAMGADCSMGGTEFNPLHEADAYGNPNPFQDPSRGRFELVKTDAAGAADVMQEEILQNLSGHNSLLGRSLTVEKRFEVVPPADGEMMSSAAPEMMLA